MLKKGEDAMKVEVEAKDPRDRRLLVLLLDRT